MCNTNHSCCFTYWLCLNSGAASFIVRIWSAIMSLLHVKPVAIQSVCQILPTNASFYCLFREDTWLLSFQATNCPRFIARPKRRNKYINDGVPQVAQISHLNVNIGFILGFYSFERQMPDMLNFKGPYNLKISVKIRWQCSAWCLLLSNIRHSDFYLISYCDCGDVIDLFYFMYINGPRWTDLDQAVIRVKSG